jgi:hypothetical protein
MAPDTWEEFWDGAEDKWPLESLRTTSWKRRGDEQGVNDEVLDHEVGADEGDSGEGG